MADIEKVIKGLECCLTLDSPCGDCPYYSYEDIQELDCERNLRHDALTMLKEQQEQIENLKQTAQSMMKGIVVSQPQIVRCKDCKHYDADTQSCLDGLDGIFQPDWFCADGERS